MYKITRNLIAIPISDFLIPLVRPSRHYHLLSYRLITAIYDWLLQFFILSKSCISLEQPPPRNCGLLHLGAVQPSSLQDWPCLTIENHHTFTFKPNLYPHLFYFFVVVYLLQYLPPSLFLALLIFLQLDVHMSRSPAGVWHYWKIDR